MTYRIISGDRRQVVKKLEELAGKRAEYTRMPRMAYIIDGIVVEKDCTVSLEEGARTDLVERLVREGLISPVSSPSEAGENSYEAEATSLAEEVESPNEAEATSPVESHIEEAENPSEAQETSSAGEAEMPTEKAESPVEATSTVESRTAEAESPAEETRSAGEDASPVEATGSAGEAENPVESQTEKAPTSYEDLIEQVEEQVEEPVSEPAVDSISFSFPLTAHRPESIINLVSTIYTRGKLLSKATGGRFSATEDLIDRLQVPSGHTTVEAVLGIIREGGGLEGLSFTEGKVVFNGFPATADEDCKKAWQALSVAINKNAIKQKHVRAKEIDDSNEKFAFRTWLTRLGMNGPELKMERQLLYRNLSGHTAFRTEKDAEKWKARQAAKRRENNQ